MSDVQPSQQLTALREAKPSSPMALRETRWGQIPDDLKDEALERTAFLTLRGYEPGRALELSLLGMSEDLTQVEYEPAWRVIRNVASNWPGLSRQQTGHYKYAVMSLASVIERAARAELSEPGIHPEPIALFMGLLPHAEFAPAAEAVFFDRVEELRRRFEQAALTPVNDDDPWDELE